MIAAKYFWITVVSPWIFGSLLRSRSGIRLFHAVEVLMTNDSLVSRIYLAEAACVLFIDTHTIKLY